MFRLSLRIQSRCPRPSIRTSLLKPRQLPTLGPIWAHKSPTLTFVHSLHRTASTQKDEPSSSRPPPPSRSEGSPQTKSPALRENIYTIPNLLTVSRIIACPVLGLAIVNENFYAATGLLVYAGLTDLVCTYLLASTLNRAEVPERVQVDGYLARRFKMQSVVGTILDPAADKILMTTLTVTLAMQGLLPGVSISSSCMPLNRPLLLPLYPRLLPPFSVPVAAIILGRDVLLSLSAFYIRYTSLPPPVRGPFPGPPSSRDHSPPENVRAILGFFHPLC